MAEIEAKFPGQVEVEIEKGGRGEFEITIDGELVYSKLKQGRFPRYAEIPAIITGRL